MKKAAPPGGRRRRPPSVRLTITVASPPGWPASRIASEVLSNLESMGLAAQAATDERRRSMTVKIVPNAESAPSGKLADAELHFDEGPLSGLKLIGFAVWERRAGGGRTVTFPARQYVVGGERRSYALLRPAGEPAAQERLREIVLAAYAESEAAGSGE